MLLKHYVSIDLSFIFENRKLILFLQFNIINQPLPRFIKLNNICLYSCIILDAVKATDDKATDKEIESCIKTWLRHSPQRSKIEQARVRQIDNNA